MKYLLNFKWKEYIDCNPDLKRNWSGFIRAGIHYVFWGVYEKRKVSNIKYVCVGNSKTATTSLLKAFNILGYNSISFKEQFVKAYVEKEFNFLINEAQNFSFLKDWPWRQLYKMIDQKYANCKFILTIREENEWVESFIRHMEREKEVDAITKARVLYYGFNPKEYINDKDFLIKNVYQKQNNDVLDYFKDRKKDLLIIDLTKPNQWDKLCSFIGCKKPKQDFPYVNKKPSGTNKIINNYNKQKYLPVIKALPQKFYLVDNVGNWGDALIKKGTLDFFKDMGYEYTFLNIGRGRLNTLKKLDAQVYKDSTVVFMGGGYFCTYWSYFDKTYFDELQKKFKKIIFLPNTYQDYKGNDFLKKLNTKKFTFFRRDNFESKTVIPHSIFAPDFALYIKHVECSTTEVVYSGYIFRGDKESSRLGFVYRNEDVSIFGNQNSQIKGFFEYVNQFKEIHTDRLHVAIAGYMMGKKVFLYPGDYRKNKGVYDTYFKNTKHIIFVNKNSLLFYKHKLQNLFFFFRNFDSKQYVQLNPDLKKNWNNSARAKVHYLLCGRKEKRLFMPSLLNINDKNNEYKLYCLYHDKIFEKYYGNQSKKITFVKMDAGPYVYKTDKHVHLQKEAWFHPIGKEWAEYEFYYSLYQGYKKGLTDLPEYLGFIQYDMEILSKDKKYEGKTIIDFIDSLFKNRQINQDKIIVFQPHSFGEIYAQKLTMEKNSKKIWGDIHSKNCLDSIREDILKYSKNKLNNSNENTQLVLAGSFFAHRKIFIEIMDFLSKIIESKKLNDYDKKIRTQGHLAERYFALYIETLNVEKIFFPVTHKNL